MDHGSCVCLEETKASKDGGEVRHWLQVLPATRHHGDRFRQKVMGGLMRDHGLQLFWGFQFQDQAGMNEHMLAINHKGIQGRIFDDQYLDPVRIQPRCLQDGLGQTTQSIFNFRVTD